MKKVKIFLLFSLFLFSKNAFASTCTTEEKERLEKLASNITYNAFTNYDNNSITFDVRLSGIHKDLTVRSTSGNMNYYATNDNFYEIIYKNVMEGNYYKIIVSGTNSCLNEKIRTITIDIPYYNRYYNEDICKNNREYSLCQKWTKNFLSYDEFYEQVTAYQKNKKSVNNNNNNSTSYEKDFYYYYRKYYWWALGSMIISLIVLIYLWIKQNNKNKL